MSSITSTRFQLFRCRVLGEIPILKPEHRNPKTPVHVSGSCLARHLCLIPSLSSPAQGHARAPHDCKTGVDTFARVRRADTYQVEESTETSIPAC